MTTNEKNMTTRKRGRPKMIEDRIVVHASIPRDARSKIDEARGKQPLATFIGEIVCEKLGIGGINA